MTDTTIECPNCHKPFRLDETLAAAAFEKREAALASRQRQIDQDGRDLKDQRDALDDAKKALDDEVAKRLATEKAAIAAKAVRARDAEIKLEVEDYQKQIADKDGKLAEARKAELELRRRERDLADKLRESDLAVQKAVEAQLETVRTKAQAEADEAARLRIMEREKTIDDLKTKLNEAVRKAEQGSQQLQGEVQELALESLLRDRFKRDSIDPVPKGQHGGDVLHRVAGPAGQACGTILWESKRTKNWSPSWLAKLRDDQRAANAEIAVMVSDALPAGLETFDLVDGVWIVGPRTVVPIAIALRHSLIELSSARAASEGQQTKMELVYRYLTGPRFRHRVEALVEKLREMQEDLDRERRTMTKLWARRSEQINGVIDATAGMYGDLQGIAGRTLAEVEGLDIPLLGPDAAT